jgi:hypothetical protein
MKLDDLVVIIDVLQNKITNFQKYVKLPYQLFFCVFLEIMIRIICF